MALHVESGMRLSFVDSDESQETVFAYGISEKLSLLFRLTYDGSAGDISDDIVQYFHGDGHAFLDRACMRATLQALITLIWRLCAGDPDAGCADVVVDLQARTVRHVAFELTRDGAFDDYITCLHPWHQSMAPDAHLLSLLSLRGSAFLGGRGDARLVYLDDTDAFPYVLKGYSFHAFLRSGPRFVTDKALLYHELLVVRGLPQHPHIMKPPQHLVTVREDGRPGPFEPGDLVCGFLQPFLSRGSMQDILFRDQRAGTRTSPARKARWAGQIASALAAVHERGQYHMDIKPGNVLVDDNDNAVVIDWEQAGASSFYLAPEADGTFNVAVVAGRLVYQKLGERGVANARASYVWPRRDVFQIWQQSCPSALQAAEVFSYGRTVWTLLDGHIKEEDLRKGETLMPKPISWHECISDIPSSWKDLVRRCVSSDPNDRPTFAAICCYWENIGAVTEGHDQKDPVDGEVPGSSS